MSLLSAGLRGPPEGGTANRAWHSRLGQRYDDARRWFCAGVRI